MVKILWTQEGGGTVNLHTLDTQTSQGRRAISQSCSTKDVALPSSTIKVERDTCLMTQSHQNSPAIRAVHSMERNELRATGRRDERSSPEKVRTRREGCHGGGSRYLNPMIGHSLQMLHLAWCLAVSAAATRCRTGSHTMDWGSSLIQSRKRAASISGLLLACVDRRQGGGWGLQRARRERTEGICQYGPSIKKKTQRRLRGSLFTARFCRRPPPKAHRSHLSPEALVKCHYPAWLLDDE